MNTTDTKQEQEAVKTILTFKIHELGFDAKPVGEVSVGPIISVYRFLPTDKTKVSHLESLAQDFAITLGVEDVLVKRMPGEVAVGIFVPNKERKFVDFKETVSNVWVAKPTQMVPINMGVDYLGRPSVVDLTLLPHLLIAGSTGSGKSTFVTSLLASIVYCVNSSEIQFVLSDTKGVDFGHFEGCPHLLFEIANSVYKTLEQMDWLIEEMNRRLKLLAKKGDRNVREFNEKATGTERLPYIIFVIDELADILSDRRKSDDSGPSIGKVAEAKLAQLAQKARASGIHIIAGTQRPSVKLVEGNIKSNFPARLSFRLPSGPDSRTVLGTEGAEHLLSQGDMMFLNPNQPGLQRLHSPFAKISDIQAAVDIATRREGI